MKVAKLLAVACLLVVGIMIVPAAQAATPTPVLIGAGSTAVFNALFDAAVNSGQCGSNYWTHGAGTYPPPFTAGGTLHDVRSSTIPDDNQKVWVVFNGTAANNYTDATTICMYVGVDSAIGDRGFLASPRAVLEISDAVGDAAGNQVNGYTDNVAALPQAIWNDINAPSTCGGTTNTGCAVTGTTMNVAFSDIRPEDAQYATFRALSTNTRNCSPNNPYSNASCYFNSNNLGYGNWVNPYTPSGSPTLVATNPVQSTFSTTEIFAVYYEQAPGVKDGFTGQPVIGYATYEVGALPVLVFVSNNDTTSLGFGAGTPGPYAAQNADLYTLAYMFDGVEGRTSDITNLPCGGSSPACVPVEEIQREPTSGTYNTFEYTSIFTHAIQDHQEDGVYGGEANPPQTWNPLSYLNSANGSIRYRAIGTGEMVKSIGGFNTPSKGVGTTTSLADRIGYVFWGYGNVGPLSGAGCTSTPGTTLPTTVTVSCSTNPVAHYLLLNGVDPLYSNVTDNPQGPLNPPTCGAGGGGSSGYTLVPPCPAIPFTHINDGSYPAWTIVRMVADASNVILGSSPSALGLVYKYMQTTSAAKYSDFDPVANLNVFRMHRGSGWGALGGPSTNWFTPVNGNACVPALPPTWSDSFTGIDMASDVGGAVTTIRADLDFALDYQGGITPGPSYCGNPNGSFVGQTSQLQ